jgi:hypothetical protein
VLQLKSPYKDATTQTFHAFLDRFLTAPPATTVAFSSSRKGIDISAGRRYDEVIEKVV